MKTDKKLFLKAQGSKTNGSVNHKGRYPSTNQRLSKADSALLTSASTSSNEPSTSRSSHATRSSKRLKRKDPSMEPSCSRSCGVLDETNRIGLQMNVPEEIDIIQRLYPRILRSSGQRLEAIERKDFEEENRILNLSTNESMAPSVATQRYDHTMSSASSSLTSSSETISALNMTGVDYNMPGCSKDTSDDSTRSMHEDPIYPDAGDGQIKEDFMQKLLNSNIEEKKDYSKGMLYKAEEMVQDQDQDQEQEQDQDQDQDEDQDQDRDQDQDQDQDQEQENYEMEVSSANVVCSSISLYNKFYRPSTSNADRLLGMDKGHGTKPVTGKPKSFLSLYCNDADDDDDSEDEVIEETWCTCLSSNEDDGEDSDEIDADGERIWRKRRNEAPLVSAKKFCPDGSYVSCGDHWPPTPGPAPIEPLPLVHYPPPDIKPWLAKFQSWTNNEKIQAIDALIGRCAAGQVRHMMNAIEPLFQRDFISLLPKELALTVLGYLSPKDLLRSAQTCRYWKFLADDNLLWKEQCRRINIFAPKRLPRNLPRSSSPWKATFMLQYLIENRWLHKPVNNPIVMRGHDDHVITCLQFYGNRILSGSDDTTLKVWSAATGKCLRTLVGHSGGVWSSQMNGHLVISGSTDRTLRIWNVMSGRCLKVLAGHTSTVRCMHLHKDRVVSGSRDASLRVWSIPDGRCLKVLLGHVAAVRCVQFDGNLIVSGAYDYFVKVWNPDSGECLHTLAGHTNRVYSLQFDGVHVVSGSLDTSIRVWDVETGQLKHTLTGHQSLTSGMELHSNILVSGNADSTVKVWDITTGQCLHTLSGPNKHQSAVTCLQTSNRFVVTSSDDGTVKLWDVHTGEFIRNLVELGAGGSGGVVWRIRASATKLVCAVGSRNGTEETKLLVLNFDLPGSCRKCDD